MRVSNMGLLVASMVAACAGEADSDPCSVCDPLASCDTSSGQVNCTCPAGYEGDGRSCTDIDECTSTSGNSCDPLVTCTNTPGSFTCGPCPQGYNDAQGDGTSCIDYDECTGEGTGNDCAPSATCENDAGTYRCICPPGREGDGVTCNCSSPVATKVYLFSAGDGQPGDIGGRAGADAKVRLSLPAALAGNAGATFAVHAFISLSGDAIADMPENWCVPADVPVVGIDASGTETALAASWDAFIAGPLATTIGAALGMADFNYYFWTGSDNAGQATGFDCDGWTTRTGATASISNRMKSTTDWLHESGTYSCDAFAYYWLGVAYCISGCD